MADQYGCTAPRYQSVCAVADIIGKPKGLSWIKKRLTQEAYIYIDIYTVLVDKVLQFNFRAPQPFLLHRGEAQGFSLLIRTALKTGWQFLRQTSCSVYPVFIVPTGVLQLP